MSFRTALVGLLVLGGCEGNVNDGSLPLTLTERQSLANDGREADNPCTVASVSGDGRLIAFQSTASNLVPGDDGLFSDVFVRDVQARTTRRISLNTGGGNPNGDSTTALISEDGAYVVFTSRADNLIAGVGTLGMNLVYRCRLSDGLIEAVSLTNSSATPNGPCTATSVSADGRYVTFVSTATDLDFAPATGVQCVYRRDMNAPLFPGAILNVSSDASGGDPDGNSSNGSITADGAYVVFTSAATDLVSTASPETGGNSDVYLWNVFNWMKERVSNTLSGGEPNGDSSAPKITPDGNWIVYQSSASDLVAGDTNNLEDIFMRARTGGPTTRISVSSAGIQAISTIGVTTGGAFPSISRDARFVAFISDAKNLFADDTNNAQDVIVRDLLRGITFPASVRTGGARLEFGASAGSPSISADGVFVVFQSASGTLVGDDQNGAQDIFRRGPLEQ